MNIDKITHKASSPFPSRDHLSPDHTSRDSTPSSMSDRSEPSTMKSESTPNSSQPMQMQQTDPIPEGHEDVDRFIKRMEMEQKMSALQSRLELASLKNGAVQPDSPHASSSFAHRRPSSSRLPPIRVEPYPQSPAQIDAARMPPPVSPIASGSRTRYEPPSPSRPWQLMDVLWQPLPPPSTAPTPAQAALLSPRKRTRDDNVKGHRRASSGNSLAMMQTKARLKDRSYSHSTTADVDAAKALAFMHRPDSSPRSTQRRSHSAKPRRLSKPQQEEEDRSAAELMMFLAHSPSPLRKPNDGPRPTPTARVLFSDNERERKSNLAAPPINSDFGGYL